MTNNSHPHNCECKCHLIVPDEMNNCDCIRFHNTTNNTQKDWVYKSEVEMSKLLQQLEGMELISPKLRLDIERVCIETNRATRADARREGFTKQERNFLIALLMILQTEFESDRAIGMRVDKKEEAMVNKILATLKEGEAK